MAGAALAGSCDVAAGRGGAQSTGAGFVDNGLAGGCSGGVAAAGARSAGAQSAGARSAEACLARAKARGSVVGGGFVGRGVVVEDGACGAVVGQGGDGVKRGAAKVLLRPTRTVDTLWLPLFSNARPGRATREHL